MLYPIELLGHCLLARTREAMDGEHVNGSTCLCHVVHLLFKCRHMPNSFFEPYSTGKVCSISQPYKDGPPGKTTHHGESSGNQGDKSSVALP